MPPNKLLGPWPIDGEGCEGPGCAADHQGELEAEDLHEIQALDEVEQSPRHT
jgi:hypothetical protein